MNKKNLIIGGSIALVLILAGVVFFLLRGNISKAEALNIAFEYLNKSQSDFVSTKVNKEIDDNLYEVELNDGTYKYEIDINMTNGKVMDFEKEQIYNLQNDNDNNDINNNQSNSNNKTTNKKNTSNEKYISADEAKTIALKHAKVKKGDAVFENVKKELEDGIVVYEIDFICNNKEYEYEIDAKKGTIIKHDIDIR